MSGSVAIWIFVIGLIAAIMLHEWGHFYTARRFGMRADRFFLGFGPTLWSMHKGETEYGVKLIPAGGFVRIKGMSPIDERLRPVPDEIFDPSRLQEDRREHVRRTMQDPLEVENLPPTIWERATRVLRERGASRDLIDRTLRRVRGSLPEHPRAEDGHAVLTEVLATEVTETGRVGDLHHRLLKGDEGRFFHDRPAWQRAIVLVAGSAMHFVIAAVVLLLGFLFLPQITGEVSPVVSEVQADSPAEEAGLQAGDRLLAVGSIRSDNYDELREAIRERPEETLTLVIRRDGQEQTLTVVPNRVEDPQTGEEIGQVGFVPTLETRRLTATEALYETFLGDASVVAMTVGTFEALGRVFGPEGLSALFSQATGQADRGLDGAVSIVGAAQLAGEAATFGIIWLIGLTASINIFVGIFNLLPLPPLDGGHLAVLGIEKAVNGVRSRLGKPTTFRIDERALAMLERGLLDEVAGLRREVEHAGLVGSAHRRPDRRPADGEQQLPVRQALAVVERELHFLRAKLRRAGHRADQNRDFH